MTTTTDAPARPSFVYDGPDTVGGMAELSRLLAGAKALPAELHGSAADILYRLVCARSWDVPVAVGLKAFYPGTDPETRTPTGLEANAILYRAVARRAGYDFDTLTLNDERCVLALTRIGAPDGAQIAAEEYTYEEAETSGTVARNLYYWTNHRRDMLYARATTRLCDRNIPEVIMGLAGPADAPRTLSTDPAAPDPATPAPAPLPDNPLRYHLDAATRDYDPAADPTGPVPTPINEMRPDRALTAAVEFVRAAFRVSSRAEDKSAADPHDPVRAAAAALARGRVDWARERETVARERARVWAEQHPNPDTDEPAPPTPVTPAPAADPDGTELPRRVRTTTTTIPAPTHDPAPAPADQAPAPAADPDGAAPPAQPAPEPKAKRTRRGPIPEREPGQSPLQRAVALLSLALRDDTTAALLTKIYGVAEEEDLLNLVPAQDGATVATRLTLRAQQLTTPDDAPDTPAADTHPAPAANPCTCDGIALTAAGGVHAPQCPTRSAQ